VDIGTGVIIITIYIKILLDCDWLISVQLIPNSRHVRKPGLDWTCKTWTGLICKTRTGLRTIQFVKHGLDSFVKHGLDSFVKHGLDSFVKHGLE
jgi:hypothetical protein